MLSMLSLSFALSVQAAQPPAMDAAQHARHAGMTHSWTDKPLLMTKAGGESRERMVVTVVPQNIVADAIDAWSNRLSDENGRRRLPLGMAGAKLDKPATGGFHWLVAREEQGGAVRVASTVYYYGERGAANPTDMFMHQKHELEIVPQPYPREHSRYRANEEWKFLVRFNGQPLSGQMLEMETQNGTKAAWVSDTQGVVTVSLPDDFKPEAEGGPGGGHGRRGADFVLAAKRTEGGTTYLTAFNASYGPDAFSQRSIVIGLVFTLLGMLVAVPLLRRRKAQKNDEPEQKAEV
jgi:hypothetical protein